MYEPLETTKCKKCGKVIAEPKELIRIKKKLPTELPILMSRPPNFSDHTSL